MKTTGTTFANNAGRDIVERVSPRKPITNVDWQALLRRWVQDYDFAKSNQTSTYLEPRGLRLCRAGLLEDEG